MTDSACKSPTAQEGDDNFKLYSSEDGEVIVGIRGLLLYKNVSLVTGGHGESKLRELSTFTLTDYVSGSGMDGQKDKVLSKAIQAAAELAIKCNQFDGAKQLVNSMTKPPSKDSTPAPAR